ncbi:hypothetical protein EDC19_1825 [Natranaerovirga hydrolytica]|uniref:Lipoprotein n=1 Tax=Natranaerovirga hydrolytica TaxID=680378 RepID=A0A4R1MLE4_9FIRM|nr:hypothetical protein [Natranaerovirga hydrolytica]TCK92672.1 hypothetical protein EDC19_1825 [Natranaerovirga hydrolytica]
MNRDYILVIGLIVLLLTGCQDSSVIKADLNNSLIVTTEIIDEIIKTDDEAIKESLENAKYEELEAYEFYIDIVDKKFKVVMEAKPFEEDIEDILYDSELLISIYDVDDLTEPVQQLSNKTNGTLFFENGVLDANFDGYDDFYYVAFRGATNASSNFFLWDNDEMCFKFSEELSELSLPSFHNDLEVVSEFNKGGAASNFTRYYKFYKDELICIRALYMNVSQEGMHVLRVEDLRQGELVEVFNKNVPLERIEEAYVGEEYDEFFQWKNLEYTGE